MIDQEKMVEILERLRMYEYEFSSFFSTDDGDYIEGMVLDLRFEQAKEAILKKKEFKMGVDWDRSDADNINIMMSEMIKGYTVKYRINVKREDLGVKMSINIVRIYMYDESGKEYASNSISVFRSMLSRMREGEKVLDFGVDGREEGV